MAHKQKFKNLKEAQDYWYDVLKKDGFDEIEDKNGSLKHWAISMQYGDLLDPIITEAKQNYYIRATHFLGTYKFDNPQDKFMWKEHSDGESIRTIVLKLKNKGFDIKRDKVHRTLNKLAKVMLSQRQNEEE